MSTDSPAATTALIPVKAFARAKRRLASVLSADERIELVQAMLCDVVAAVLGTEAIDRANLLGGPDAGRLAAAVGADWLDDRGEPDLNAALNRGAASLAQNNRTTLLVLPSDLPTLQSADIAALLACHREGMTLCPARSDGGTNALVLNPPDAIQFRFGPDSARRHLAAAMTAGLPGQRLEMEAFARDIDRPADLRWLCRQRCGSHTQSWLDSNNIANRLGNNGQTALQA